MTATHARDKMHEKPFWRTYMQSRFTILFYTLLLMLVALPVAEILGLPQILIKLLLSVSLLAAVMSNATRRSRHALLVFILTLIALRLGSDAGYLPVGAGSMFGVSGIIGLLAAAGALRFVIQSEEVDKEAIYAALSTYLLAGIFFGQLHWSIESHWPGSYSAPEQLTEASAIYFSFITLASLGYGDILPRSDMARGLAIFEVVGGQLFLAVTIARLVGLFRGSDRNA